MALLYTRAVMNREKLVSRENFNKWAVVCQPCGTLKVNLSQINATQEAEDHKKTNDGQVHQVKIENRIQFNF